MNGYVDVTVNSVEFESVPMVKWVGDEAYVQSDGAYSAFARFGDSPVMAQYEDALYAAANECGEGITIDGKRFGMSFRRVYE